MNDIQKFHDQAMNLAERAFSARIHGKKTIYKKSLNTAFGLERKAAEIAIEMHCPEPTRSVLLRSAASLALDCMEYREAERLISIALAGNPPLEIAEELRDLFEQANFQR